MASWPLVFKENHQILMSQPSPRVANIQASQWPHSNRRYVELIGYVVPPSKQKTRSSLPSTFLKTMAVVEKKLEDVVKSYTPPAPGTNTKKKNNDQQSHTHPTTQPYESVLDNLLDVLPFLRSSITSRPCI